MFVCVCVEGELSGQIDECKLGVALLARLALCGHYGGNDRWRDPLLLNMRQSTTHTLRGIFAYKCCLITKREGLVFN